MFVESLETVGEESAALSRPAAESAGVGPIERGVDERDARNGRAFTTVPAVIGLEPGLCPGLPMGPKALLLSDGGFGRESLIANADAGRRATSLSSAAIIVFAVCGETMGASSDTRGKLKGGCSCGSRPVSRWCIVAASA